MASLSTVRASFLLLLVLALGAGAAPATGEVVPTSEIMQHVTTLAARKPFIPLSLIMADDEVAVFVTEGDNRSGKDSSAGYTAYSQKDGSQITREILRGQGLWGKERLACYKPDSGSLEVFEHFPGRKLGKPDVRKLEPALFVGNLGWTVYSAPRWWVLYGEKAIYFHERATGNTIVAGNPYGEQSRVFVDSRHAICVKSAVAPGAKAMSLPVANSAASIAQVIDLDKPNPDWVQLNAPTTSGYQLLEPGFLNGKPYISYFFENEIENPTAATVLVSTEGTGIGVASWMPSKVRVVGNGKQHYLLCRAPAFIDRPGGRVSYSVTVLNADGTRRLFFEERNWDGEAEELLAWSADKHLTKATKAEKVTVRCYQRGAVLWEKPWEQVFPVPEGSSMQLLGSLVVVDPVELTMPRPDVPAQKITLMRLNEPWVFADPALGVLGSVQ